MKLLQRYLLFIGILVVASILVHLYLPLYIERRRSKTADKSEKLVTRRKNYTAYESFDKKHHNFTEVMFVNNLNDNPPGNPCTTIIPSFPVNLKIFSNLTDYENLLKIVQKSRNTDWLLSRMKSIVKYWEKERLIFVERLLGLDNKNGKNVNVNYFKKVFYMNYLDHTKLNASSSRKTILLHLGLLDPKSNMRIAESIKDGGPVGELVQWSDIILTLFTLGYKIKVTTDSKVAARIIGNHQQNSPNLIIFTDIIGYKLIRRNLGSTKSSNIKCQFRIVDSFGTDQKFNNLLYSSKVDKKPNAWGRLDFNLKQFGTLYPYGRDNSFYGYALYDDSDEAVWDHAEYDDTGQKPKLLVYGKHETFWGNENIPKILEIFRKNFQIHATVAIGPGRTGPGSSNYASTHIPPYVINHGILSPQNYKKLLKSCQIYLGLGFPYDGPAAMEAVSNNLIFIQPLIKPEPINRYNNEFFSRKPTERLLYSQHDYLFRNVGEPFVYTIDYGDISKVEEISGNILKTLTKRRENSTMSSKKRMKSIPYEFSVQGMLERFLIYVETQNFCVLNATDKTNLHDLSAKTFIAVSGKSDCNTVCEKYNEDESPSSLSKYYCENDLFENLNNRLAFLKLKFSRPPQSSETEHINQFQHQITVKSFEVDTTNIENLKKYKLNLPISINNHYYLAAGDWLKKENYFSCDFYENSDDLFNFSRICPCVRSSVDQRALCEECALFS